jgi:hypothetical protein
MRQVKGNEMKKLTKIVLVTLILPFAIMEISCSKQRAKWKGSIEEVAGVITVKNPIEPIYGEESLSAEEELSIGTGEGEPEPLFSQIRDIAVDDEENIYVLDLKEAHIKKFSKYGMYIKTIGKKGGGPGEIGMPAFISISKGREIIVEDPMKRSLIFYSLDGVYSRSISCAKILIVQVECDSEGSIIGSTIDVKNQAYEVRKVDREMNLICSYGSTPLPVNSQIYNPFKPTLRWALLPDDTVICSNPEQYLIEVYDNNGKIIKRIFREFQPVEITQEEIEEAKRTVPQGRELKVDKYHPPYFRIATDNEGIIYAQTHERKPGVKGFYNDVFDREGKYIAKFILNEFPRVIKNRKAYTIEEDAQGYQYVKRYKLAWKF